MMCTGALGFTYGCSALPLRTWKVKHKRLTPAFNRRSGARPGTEAGADLVSVYGPEPLVRVLVRPQLQIHACERHPSQHSSGAQDQGN